MAGAALPAPAAVRLHAFGTSLSLETADAAAAAGAPLACSVWDAGLVCFHYLAGEPPGFTRCGAGRPAAALQRCSEQVP